MRAILPAEPAAADLCVDITAGAKKTISKTTSQTDKECRCCGKTGHVFADCKMKDKECSVCGKVGHLKAMCRSAGGGELVFSIDDYQLRMFRLSVVISTVDLLILW